MIDHLLMPFQMAFLRDAFLIALIVSVPTALLSCFLVLKGWALMGDAVSHAVLPGIVLAWLAGIPVLAGAFAAGMATVLATGFLSANSRVKSDTVMGVVFSGMFALGIVLQVALAPGVHLDHILFGNLLGVGAEDLRTTGIIALIVVAVLLVTWRDLLLHAFDPVQARATGLRVGLLHYGLLTLLSLTIVATLSATGLILAVGLLIAPGATAFLLVRRFGAMLGVAVALNAFAMVAGIWASVHLDSAPAPTIILVLTALFLGALTWRVIGQRRATSA